MTEDSRSDVEPAIPVGSTPGESATERLEIRDFTESSASESEELDSSLIQRAPNDAPKCWYCGLAEAFGWFFGMFVVHVGGAIAVFVGIFIYFMLTTGKPPASLEDPYIMMTLAGGEMGLFVLASILAISLRYWGRTFNELNFSRPDLRHLLIVILGTIPLSFCVSAWSMPIQLGWQSICEWYPVLKILDQLNAMESIKQMAEVMPLSVMILVIGVTPAIGEEVVFRAAIGRVLIANLGLWSGVLLSSFLFGCAHVHPVHALAVMPVGLAIHLVYLSTRSFWMPMLLHFVNNSWASFVTKQSYGDPVDHLGHLTLIEGIEIATALIAVVAFGFCLWQSRVRLFQADGEEWKTGRFPLRIPAIPGIQRRAGRINSICWTVALASAVVCHLSIVIDLMQPVVKGK